MIYVLIQIRAMVRVYVCFYNHAFAFLGTLLFLSRKNVGSFSWDIGNFTSESVTSVNIIQLVYYDGKKSKLNAAASTLKQSVDLFNRRQTTSNKTFRLFLGQGSSPDLPTSVHSLS